MVKILFLYAYEIIDYLVVPEVNQLKIWVFKKYWRLRKDNNKF